MLPVQMLLVRLCAYEKCCRSFSKHPSAERLRRGTWRKRGLSSHLPDTLRHVLLTPYLSYSVKFARTGSHRITATAFYEGHPRANRGRSAARTRSIHIEYVFGEVNFFIFGYFVCAAVAVYRAGLPVLALKEQMQLFLRQTPLRGYF